MNQSERYSERFPLRYLLAICAVAAFASAVVPAPARAARGIDFGIGDGAAFFAVNDADRAKWFSRTAESGASFVSLGAQWRAIAPRSRDGFDPQNPADPGYRWTRLDAAVRDATARGLQVLLFVYRAPDWAEGPNRPANVEAGWWNPNPEEYGSFGGALASRYSGAFPDPLNPGSALPRVQYFQVWNEPNLPHQLSPQWQGKKGTSPVIYRNLLNAFYEQVKAVNAMNQVIAGGTSPFGDPKGGERMRPIQFFEELLCLTKATRPGKSRCRERAHFDIYSHHPIASETRPRYAARHPKDATVPDLDRIRRAVSEARKKKTIQPAGRKPLWVTEFWWPSKPPYENIGIPVDRHARYLEEAMYLFWKARAQVAIWLKIVDPERPAVLGGPIATGLYFADETPKPALQAFRFPFVTDRLHGKSNKVQAWGKSPVGGSVTVERRSGNSWRPVTTVNAGNDGVFATQIKSSKGDELRAVAASDDTSLTWRQG